MDVNETLRRIREVFHDLDRTSNPTELLDLSEEAARLFDALDGWMSKGGALPAEWEGWRL